MERTDIDRREDRATGRTAIAVILLAVAVTSGVASASECGEDRAGGGTRKIVVRGGEGISPSAFTMNCGDVLAFENDSGEVVKLVFVEPRDQSEKIRCAPADHTVARPDQMPWLLFDWGPGRQLTATMPPGTFPSICSLAPGEYAFVAKPIHRDPRGAEDSLGTKGTITVQ